MLFFLGLPHEIETRITERSKAVIMEDAGMVEAPNPPGYNKFFDFSSTFLNKI